MLTPFGELFERLCAERGLSKRAVAEQVGIAHSRLTESLRDPDEARRSGDRWYAPDLAKLDDFARIFKLSDDEREEFTRLAHLAHSTVYIQTLIANARATANRQDAELRELRGMLQASQRTADEAQRSVAELRQLVAELQRRHPEA